MKQKLKIVNEKVDKLNNDYKEANEKLVAVQTKAQNCIRKLQSAEKLVHGLSEENQRWAENVINLEKSKDQIIGDSLLAAAFVSYIPAFSQPFRTDLC